MGREMRGTKRDADLSVLVVTNMYPSPANPALGTFVQDQVESIRALGVRMDVLFVNGPRGKIHYLLGVFRYLWWMLRRGHQYDLVHAHYVFSGLISRLQWWLPIVLTHHGIEVVWGWQGPLSRLVSRWVDRLIVTSRAVADSLGRSDAAVIPCGVNLTLFQPMSRGEARRRLGLSPEAHYILYAGRTGPEKRLDLLHEAVSRLREDDPSAELILLTGRPHQDVPLYLNAVDALVLVSDYEGSPLVIKEALACNLPIVSTDVGDVAELTAGVDGCYLCEQSADDVAARLREALAYGRPTNGRDHVQHLSLETIARQILDVYHEVLA